MAIAYDAASTTQSASPATSDAVTFTTSGSDRFLVVGIRHNTSAVTFTVTYNSVSMTEIGSGQLFNGDTNRMRLFYLINPASGSNTVSVTPSASDYFQWSVASYNGVDQASQPDSSNSGETSGVSTHPISTTVVAEDSWMVGVWGGGGWNITAGTGTTERSSGVDFYALGDSNGALASGSRTLTMTTGGNEAEGQIALSFDPASAAGPANVKTVNEIAIASVKTMKAGVAIASVKTWNDIA